MSYVTAHPRRTRFDPFSRQKIGHNLGNTCHSTLKLTDIKENMFSY